MNQDFQEFYDDSFKAAYRFFFYKNVSKSQIEDLVQDSFMRFYQSYQFKLGDKDERGKILLGICLNVYREWVRVQVSTGNVWEYIEEVDWEEERVSFDEYSNPDYEIEVERRKALLRQSLSELSGTVRSVLELRFLQGLTRAQTADKLGISEDQVHTYQKRGIKYLKEILNQEESNQTIAATDSETVLEAISPGMSQV
jgi:RNA polymerase sigma factor (sigma-70 family)